MQFLMLSYASGPLLRVRRDCQSWRQPAPANWQLEEIGSCTWEVATLIDPLKTS